MSILIGLNIWFLYNKFEFIGKKLENFYLRSFNDYDPIRNKRLHWSLTTLESLWIVHASICWWQLYVLCRRMFNLRMLFTNFCSCHSNVASLLFSATIIINFIWGHLILYRVYDLRTSILINRQRSVNQLSCLPFFFFNFKLFFVII